MVHEYLASWSRFTVKQTYDTLKPKNTFTSHVSNHQSGTDSLDIDIIVHGPQSTRYGWEWYETGFIAYWNSSGLVTLVCFDVPEKMQFNVQSLFGVNPLDTSARHAVFSLVSGALLRMYDDSGQKIVVWKFLIAHVNMQSRYYGNALCAASYKDYEVVVKLLLEKGADVNAQGGFYGNALQTASHGGHEAIVP